MVKEIGKKRKAPPHAFKPGQSGNMNGRPRKTEEQVRLEEMCREKTTEALNVILEIMTDGQNERNKLAAAEFVIERGWGKATEKVDIDLKGKIRTINEIRLVAPSCNL